jgi:acetyltransferase-like isoleucine patch superfamily enzyme
MIRKIKKFFTYSFSRKKEVIENYYYLFKTQFVYKAFFLSLGSGSIIRKQLLITPEYISFGKNVNIGPHARIEGTKEWHEHSYHPSLVVGDNVIFQQRCHITFCGSLSIGSNTFAAHDVMITDIDHNYVVIDKPICEQNLIIRETVIGKNCFIGSGVKIQAGTKLGRQCIVGANSVVRGEFPDYSVIVGAPAKVVKQYDSKSKCWKRV